MHEPFIYLAPLRGLTDFGFRNLFCKHFEGYDAAVAPFINPQQNAAYDDKMLRDVLPVNNQGLNIVPQLLHTDPGQFLVLAGRLSDMGYSHINWNLGCPAPMVARKQRGSGILPYPDKIISLLDELVPKLPCALSLKTRLGYNAASELLALLPRLADYSLKEITIHTRLGKQLYRGTTDPDAFGKCLAVTRHTLVYNGDVNSLADYKKLQADFPQVHSWMMGRGAIGNPFLAEEIKFARKEEYAVRTLRLRAFHDELFDHYTSQLSGPGHILGKLKQFWTYFSASFPESPRGLKQILKCHTTDKYQETVNKIFAARHS